MLAFNDQTKAIMRGIEYGFIEQKKEFDKQTKFFRGLLEELDAGDAEFIKEQLDEKLGKQEEFIEELFDDLIKVLEITNSQLIKHIELGPIPRYKGKP